MTANIELVLCPTCGQPVLPNSRFCSSCGTALATGDTTAMPQVDESGPLPVLDPEAVAGLAPGEAVLVIHRGPAEGARFELKDSPVTVGRGSDSTVFLDDVTVSRRHAEFARTDEGWTVTDVGSLNGTYVNKKLVDTVVLTTGDEVQIGKYRFLFFQAVPA
ncbi:MAG: FHA domain-containing protein [Candidatus Nanopelagicales bacterium]